VWLSADLVHASPTTGIGGKAMTMGMSRTIGKIPGIDCSA
jgi:hypothetical protein